MSGAIFISDDLVSHCLHICDSENPFPWCEHKRVKEGGFPANLQFSTNTSRNFTHLNRRAQRYNISMVFNIAILPSLHSEARETNKRFYKTICFRPILIWQIIRYGCGIKIFPFSDLFGNSSNHMLSLSHKGLYQKNSQPQLREQLKECHEKHNQD